MSDNELFEKGLKTRTQVLGTEYVETNIAGSDDFMMALQRAVTELAWGYAWSRPGLDRKTRSVLTLGILAGLGRFQELGIYTKSLAHPLRCQRNRRHRALVNRTLGICFACVITTITVGGAPAQTCIPIFPWTCLIEPGSRPAPGQPLDLTPQGEPEDEIEPPPPIVEMPADAYVNRQYAALYAAVSG